MKSLTPKLKNPTPTNDYAKAMLILIKAGTFSMADVLTQWDSTFYKIQTRMGDIQRSHPKLLISKKSIEYTSKLSGKRKHYTNYTLKSPYTYAVNLYNFLNKNGLNEK